MTDGEQLKANLDAAGIPYLETSPNLTDDLVGVLLGAGGSSGIEFYFSLGGELLNVELVSPNSGRL